MTARALIKAWANRDRQYAARRISGIRAPLSQSEAESVRWWRAREVTQLSKPGLAPVVLAGWTPPEVMS